MAKGASVSIITMSGEMGSFRDELALEICDRGGLECINRKILMDAVKDSFDLSRDEMQLLAEQGPAMLDMSNRKRLVFAAHLESVVLEYAMAGGVVLVGRGGQPASSHGAGRAQGAHRGAFGTQGPAGGQRRRPEPGPGQAPGHGGGPTAQGLCGPRVRLGLGLFLELRHHPEHGTAFHGAGRAHRAGFDRPQPVPSLLPRPKE